MQLTVIDFILHILPSLLPFSSPLYVYNHHASHVFSLNIGMQSRVIENTFKNKEYNGNGNKSQVLWLNGNRVKRLVR